MNEESNAASNMLLPLTYFNENNVKHLKQFCSGKLPHFFFHPSLYRALKLIFPWDIGSLSLDGIIKTVMGQGSMEQVVGILYPAMCECPEPEVWSLTEQGSFTISRASGWMSVVYKRPSFQLVTTRIFC